LPLLKDGEIIVDLIKQVREAGVVGAGGAGFPTHVKLDAKVDYFILNGAECEPLLRVDQQLIKAFAPEVIAGVKSIIETIGANKAFIAIKGKHKDAVQRVTECIDDDRISIMLLEDFYPAGDEQVLVYEVLHRVVPEMGIPLKVGCVVMNTETVLNIYNSLSDIPVTETYLTITGKVSNPITLKLPIGTSIRDALSHCGVMDIKGIKVIDGGPMMGKIIDDINDPITKTTKGLILLDEEHQLIRKKAMPLDRARRIARVACEQCRMCTDLCPRYLLGHNMQPHKMMRKVSYKYENLEDAEIAFLCCECNLCELYACPVNITPKSINVLYKKLLGEKGMKYTPEKTEFSPRATRDYRKVPIKRLIQKLGLLQYDKPALLVEMNYEPSKIKIPLKQHTGAPAVPIVTIGQLVKKGELVGEIPEKALGARIHASISGKVTAIDNYITIERD
jgi:Na+-translocating ferredoxin:NAD+ oxidoreductase RnfC subunit